MSFKSYVGISFWSLTSPLKLGVGMVIMANGAILAAQALLSQ